MQKVVKMRGKNLVHASAYPISLRSRVFSAETVDSQDHDQYHTWKNQRMLMHPPQPVSPISSIESSVESLPKQRKRHKSVKVPPKKKSCIKIVLVALGLLVAAIALTGMGLGIYAVVLLQQTTTTNATQAAASTTTTTTSTTTTTVTTASTTTTAALPGQCFSYTIYNDATRLATAAGGSASDISLFSAATTWVRFIGAGGSLLATSPPTYNRCGAVYSGWYIDELPEPGHTAVGTVCYVLTTTSTCFYFNQISVSNCGSFYVYGLTDPPISNSRYCTV